MKSLNIEIAGIVASFDGIPAKAQKALKKHYGGFTSKTEDGLKWEVEWGAPANEHGPWDIRTEYDLDRWVFSRGDFRGEWRPSRGRGTLSISADALALDALLQAWYAMVLVERGGGLFKGVGVAAGERGFFYAGPSEKDRRAVAGKFDPGDIIAGEIAALIKKSGRFVVCGTPFGDTRDAGGKNACAAIDKIIMLGGEGGGGPHKLAFTEAANELWGSVVYSSRSIDMQNRTMAVCENIVSQLPCERSG